jgi:hypothetical protein
MLFGHEALMDRERELRRSAEERRRLESRRERVADVDAEIRDLILREEAHTACANCPDEELVREAG